MKLYRKIIPVVIFLLMAQKVCAQNHFPTGSLQDQQGEAIPFANVAVLKLADSSLVTGTVTDQTGVFKIQTPKNGKYLLKLSAIGFTSVFSEAFEIKPPQMDKDFGPVLLEEEVAMLDEVEVEAMRPMVSVEADKMVVTVEGTVLASGSTAFEVISKSPGVWIDQDGNLQLNGKQGVEVMIDGRPTYLSAKELQSLLEGIPAENLQNIEIITNPSAKYDAEGTAGILNINLKKNNLSGINGSLYGGYQYNRLHFYNTGANLNFKKGKWSSFASLDVAERGRLREQRMERGFRGESGTARFYQSGREINRRFVPSLRVGIDYDLSDRHSIGFMANLSYQDGYNDWNSLARLQDYSHGKNMHIDARNHLEDAFTNN